MPKVKKPVLATADDLTELTAKLQGEIQKAAQANQQFVQTVEQRLQGELKKLDNAQNAHAEELRAGVAGTRADSRQYTEECVKNLNDQIVPMVSKLEDDIAASSNALAQEIEQLDAGMRDMLSEEMTSLCMRFDEELAAVKVELSGNMAQWATEAAESLVAQRAEIDASLALLQQQLQTNAEEALVKFVHVSEHERVVTEHSKRGDKETERINIQHAEIYVKMGLIQEALEDAIATTARDGRTMAADGVSSLAKLTDHAKERLGKLDTDTQRLLDSMSVVESFTTKRVEWVIKNASKKLRADWGESGTKLHTGWFSPKFDAAGCFGLQLELQMFRVTEAELEGKQEIGNLAAFLWACRGMTIVYKLYIGNKSMIMEKSFNGRVPYGTPRLCWLQDQINKEDDTLRVGIEILETVREVEHPIKPPQLPPKALGDDIASADAAHAAREAAKHAAEGSLFFKRHITNRLMDQVHREVELMRSRMVRKIEWCVQHASLLCKCFPKDEAICSPAFNAAGVEKLQFVLYPSGYTSATEGFCSLYIYGPVGATLRCQFSIGKQTRQILHTFDDSGAVGRTNFCNWESVIESGIAADNVLIRLEIEEAQQDMRAAITHKEVVPGDRRTLGQIDGSDTPGIESVVKLTRDPGSRQVAPGSSGPGLEEQLVLPSLWSPKRLGDTDCIPEGLKKFDELLDHRPARAGMDPIVRPASAARPNSATSHGVLRKHASLPGRIRSSMRRCPGNGNAK